VIQLAESLWSKDVSYVRITRNKEEQTVCETDLHAGSCEVITLTSLVETVKG